MVQLEGECRVVGLREGEPARSGTLSVWEHFRGVNVALRVIEGRGKVRSERDEALFEMGSETSLYLRAGDDLEVDGTYVAVSGPRCGDVKMDPGPLLQTGDRFYRELIQGEITQFVGSIPPGRAPDHFHLYEEMLCILEGHGVMWAGSQSTPIGPGSCVYLPREQVHCVENRSDGPLRLLGVFYPAGSPAVRYSAR